VIQLFKDTDLERRKVVYLIDTNKSAIISATQSVEDAIEVILNMSRSKYSVFACKFFWKSKNILFN